MNALSGSMVPPAGNFDVGRPFSLSREDAMTSSYAQSPKYAAAGQSRGANGHRALPVLVQEESPQRVGWIVTVPLAAFAAGLAAGAILAAGLIRIASR